MSCLHVHTHVTHTHRPIPSVLSIVQVRCVVNDTDTGGYVDDTTEMFMYGCEMLNTKLHVQGQWVRIVFTPPFVFYPL
jgi:hypothetical protein